MFLLEMVQVCLPGGATMHAAVTSSDPSQKPGGSPLIWPKKHALFAFSTDWPPHVHVHSAAQQMSAFFSVP